MYTPGPYTVDDQLAESDRVISGPEGQIVALVTGADYLEEGDEPSDEQRDATAQLLAAAPELFAEHDAQIKRMETWLGVLNAVLDHPDTVLQTDLHGHLMDVADGLHISIDVAQNLVNHVRRQAPVSNADAALKRIRLLAETDWTQLSPNVLRETQIAIRRSAERKE